MRRKSVILLTVVAFGVAFILLLGRVKHRRLVPNPSHSRQEQSATNGAQRSSLICGAPPSSPSAISNRAETIAPARGRVASKPVELMTEAHGLTDEQSKKLPPRPQRTTGLNGYKTKQQLMDALLEFVKKHPNEDVKPFAKALRGWAREHNVPFSK